MFVLTQNNAIKRNVDRYKYFEYSTDTQTNATATWTRTRGEQVH